MRGSSGVLTRITWSEKQLMAASGRSAAAQESGSTQPAVLREYAVLGDGHRGALIGPRGEIAWMCFPSWHSPAIFSSLIGGSGEYAITPAGRFVWGGYYEEGSLIWRSRWVTGTGAVLECREALVFPSQSHQAILLRQLRPVNGESVVEVALHPRGGYGAEPLRSWRRHDGGGWTAAAGELRLRWSGYDQMELQADGAGGRRLVGRMVLRPGQRTTLVLELSTTAFERDLSDPERLWEVTEAGWSEAVPELAGGAAQRDRRHALTVLTGLSSPSGGGLVAAATCSLPERADQGRSYDYRYAWIRDQCFAGQAMAASLFDAGQPHTTAGAAPELFDRTVSFVRDRVLADGPQLVPAYCVTGEAVPDQCSLDLPGYPGGTDIVGNHVREQFQLDAFGEVLLLFAVAARNGRADAEVWRAAEVAISAIEQRWDEDDAGIWEIEPAWWAHSRLECVAGLRALCAAGAPASKVGEWTGLADALLAATSSRCVHPTGRWQRAPDDPAVDAALLFPGIRGGLAVDDPRTVATVGAVREELTRHGYVYRFKPDDRPLGVAEGAFLLCSFALSIAVAQQDRPVESCRWFERARAACGPPGLYSEEYDVTERQMRGNLPQAFVHALFLEAATWQDRLGER